MLHSTRLWTLAVFISLCPACPEACDNTPAPAPEACEPRTSRACDCGVSEGVQNCPADGSAWGACICPIVNVVMKPAARPVRLRGDSAVAVDDSTVRMPIAGHDDVAALGAGDILVHMGNPPLLRRVVSTRLEGGELVIETAQAGIEDAFEELDIEMSNEPINMFAALPERVRNEAETNRLGMSGKAGGISFGASVNIHPSIQVSNNSRVWFDPDVTTKLVVKAGGMREFKFIVDLDTGFDITFITSVSGDVSLSAEIELIEAVLKAAGPEFFPYKITVPLGAGFTANPVVYVGCELSAEGELTMSNRVHLNFDIHGGVDFDRRRARDDEWRLINDISVLGGADPPAMSYNAGVGLTCYVKPGIELTFLEVVHGSASVGPKAAASLHVGVTPSFSVDLSIVGTVGASIEALDIEFWSKEWDVFDYTKNLYYKEFSICGDGYRNVINHSTDEECDFGPGAAGHCTDCKCDLGYLPTEFIPNLYYDSDYHWSHGLFYCRKACGNGQVDPDEGEACDVGLALACDAFADYFDGCAEDCSRNIGVPADGIIDAQCGEVCDDGNTEDCDGCSANNRSDETCGNGVWDYRCGEECEHGVTFGPGHCTDDCTYVAPSCPNGYVEEGEECDDGNWDPCDGCYNNCTLPTGPSCGDGLICGDEECDTWGESFTCTANCTRSSCGDGYVNVRAYEECDDGNDDDCDDCHNDCTLNERRCGDGVVCGDEECDPGRETSSCDADCTWRVCGDGYTNELAEACDDGDTDSCTSACNWSCSGPGVTPVCGDGRVDCGEVCDRGSLNGECGFCSADCTASYGVCGDGIVDALCSEVCDDGNTLDGDGCESNCRSDGSCGNGVVDTGEVCDDGNRIDCDGHCSADCQVDLSAACGNGSIDQPCEVCEDSVPDNSGVDLGCTTSQPNCTGCARCSADVCGDGVVGPSEGCEVQKTCLDESTPCTSVADCPLLGNDECRPVFGEGQCDPTCTRIQTCGDGYLDAFEVCDDGNTNDNDGCNSTCTGS